MSRSRFRDCTPARPCAPASGRAIQAALIRVVRAFVAGVGPCIALLLALFISGTAQAQCGPFPTANAITASNSLTLTADFLVNGNLTSGSGTNLPTTGVRNNNPTTFPSLQPSTYPSFSSNTNVNNGPVAAGSYSNINLSGTQTFTGGTYYISNLNVTGGTVTLGSGTYFITTFQMGNGVTVNTSGAVRIYVGSFLGAGNFLNFNTAGPTSNLVVTLASNANVNISNNASFRGVIYGTSNNSVTFSNFATLTGMIAVTGNVNLTTGSSITFSAADQAAIGGTSTCDPNAVGLVADYHFDECSYNGTSGEAKDSRGSYHATSSGAKPSTAAGGVIGRYLNTTALNAYLLTTSKVPLPGAYTISSWYRTPFTTDASNQYHVLGSLDASGSTCMGDLMFSDDKNSYRWGVYSQSGGIVPGTQSVNLTSGWHHVALVASGNTTQIYLDGTLRDSVALRINRTSASLGMRYIGTSCDNVNVQAFRAPIDEFMVFNSALSSTDISNIYTNQRNGKNWDGTTRASTCAPAVGSFLITGTGSASTCSPQTITITARDASGNTITGYTGTVTLRTSSNLGTWAKGSSPTPGGTLTAGSNDGQATYTFVAGDQGVAKFTLTHQAARDVTVTVTDTSTLVATTSATVQFRDNAFVWTEDLNNKISGSWIAVAGRTHDLQLELWKKDATTGLCSKASDYTGSRNLKIWRTDSSGSWTDPTVQLPSPLSPVSVTTTKPAASNLALTFTAGAASVNLGTTDVGQYTLNVADETNLYASNAISGSSSVLTVRPFTIVVNGIVMGATANPNGSAAGDAVFGAAGANFSATVGGYRWSSAADSAGDGVPDAGVSLATATAGGLAPKFAATVTLSPLAGSQTPATGVLGSLNNGAVSVSGGASTATTLQYTEVGSFQLATAGALTDYLGVSGLNVDALVFNSAGVQNTTVGRFIPASFALSSGSVKHRSTASCAPAAAFTYLGENFELGFDLEARNALGARTQNYTGAYAKLALGTPSSFGPAGIAGSTTFKTGGGRLTAVSSAGTWALGQAAAVKLVLNAARATGAGGASTPDGPFTASFGILPSDGEASGVSTANLDTDSPANGNDRGLVATVALRYGRLRLQNAIGSQNRSLSLPLQALYWDGSVYQTNTLDSCTSISSNQISFGNYRKTMTSADATVLSSPITLNQGQALITLAKPLTGHNGSYDVALALGSTATDASCLSWTPAPAAASGANLTHLRWPWCGTAADKDPSARASFGVYGGPGTTLFQREN